MKKIIVLLLVALLLAACGDDGNYQPITTEQPVYVSPTTAVIHPIAPVVVPTPTLVAPLLSENEPYQAADGVVVGGGTGEGAEVDAWLASLDGDDLCKVTVVDPDVVAHPVCPHAGGGAPADVNVNGYAPQGGE